MALSFEDRRSDSPCVERVWRSQSERTSTFLSIAASHFEMVVTHHEGKTVLTLRGPETEATPAFCPRDAEWIGIRFAVGTYMPAFPPGTLIDRQDVTLPGASARAFWLNGSAWEYPDFDNADVFVARLIRTGVIARDAVVHSARHRHVAAQSTRSVQRHFLRATGMTSSTWRQIERARYATTLLRDGTSILDTVHQAGYFDQSHLTRSLKHRVGQTPAEIIRESRQLSFLYKTTPLG
jgi:Helix-turn-helix domain